MSRARAFVFFASWLVGAAWFAQAQDLPKGQHAIEEEVQEEDAEPTPEPEDTPVPKVDTSKLPVQEKILEESFPGYFQPLNQEKSYFWSLDLNGDENEDLVILAQSKKKVPNAWKKLPIHNPPYEWASRGEIQENPMFETHYSMRENERYLIVYHAGPRGWKNLSVGTAYVLQDVAEKTPEPTTFGDEGEEANGLKFHYEGKPGLLYWAGDRYVAVMKEEGQ